jgi:hypothetical protein
MSCPQCGCAIPEVVNVPGLEGDPGDTGAAGISSIALTTGVITLPGSAGAAGTVTVSSSLGFAINQIVWISIDSTHNGTFQITAIPSASAITISWLHYPNDQSAGGTTIGIGATVVPAGVKSTGTPPTPLITDNSGGTISTTIDAATGIEVIPLFINLPKLANGANVVTAYTRGINFKITKISFGVEEIATTAAKAATLTTSIGGTALTGGVLSLTTTNCGTAGLVTNATAITGLNTGSGISSITIAISGVTTFVEGSGWIFLQIQNMDTVNALASLTARVNALTSLL